MAKCFKGDYIFKDVIFFFLFFKILRYLYAVPMGGMMSQPETLPEGEDSKNHSLNSINCSG